MAKKKTGKKASPRRSTTSPRKSTRKLTMASPEDALSSPVGSFNPGERVMYVGEADMGTYAPGDKGTVKAAPLANGLVRTRFDGNGSDDLVHASVLRRI